MFLLTTNFQNKRNYSFMRTFVIIREENEYKISNDMLCLRSVLSNELPKDLQPELVRCDFY